MAYHERRTPGSSTPKWSVHLLDYQLFYKMGSAAAWGWAWREKNISGTGGMARILLACNIWSCFGKKCRLYVSEEGNPSRSPRQREDTGNPLTFAPKVKYHWEWNRNLPPLTRTVNRKKPSAIEKGARNPGLFNDIKKRSIDIGEGRRLACRNTHWFKAEVSWLEEKVENSRATSERAEKWRKTKCWGLVYRASLRLKLEKKNCEIPVSHSSGCYHESCSE